MPHRNDRLIVGLVVASLGLATSHCSGKESVAPSAPLVIAPVVRDTAFYVGESARAYSLMAAADGRPFGPGPTTHVRIIAGTTNTITLATDGILSFVAPGAVVVEVSDDAAGWTRTFRVGSVLDLRRAWRFTSYCLLNGGSWSDDTFVATRFLAATATVTDQNLDGHPRWLDGKPFTLVHAPGTQVDSSFHYYIHYPDGGIRPDTTVATRTMVGIIGADSSRSIGYIESPDGRTSFRSGNLQRVPGPGLMFRGDALIYCHYSAPPGGTVMSLEGF